MNLIEKKREIEKKIEKYLEKNEINIENIFFQNEYLISVDFTKEPEEEKIYYTFPELGEDPTSEEISKAISKRFFKDKKDNEIIFKKEFVNENKYHTLLIKKSIMLHALKKDLNKILKSYNLSGEKILKYYKVDKYKKAIEMSDLIKDCFILIAMNEINVNLRHIPSFEFICKKIKTTEGLQIISKEYGEKKAKEIDDILPDEIKKIIEY